MNPDEEAVECKTCRHEPDPEDKPPCSLCSNGRFYESKSNASQLNNYPASMVAGAGMIVGVIIGGIGGLLIGLAL